LARGPVVADNGVVDALQPSVLAVALAFALVVLAIIAVRAWWRSFVLHARSARAVEGEREAAAILRARGYAIVESQITVEYPVEVDGETVSMGLRADYLVVKNGAYFIAEVKTGKRAPRIDTAATRRQLLEYEVAFGVDGVLLVDADAARVHTIAFPTLASRR
jgi:hypothetical protein